MQQNKERGTKDTLGTPEVIRARREMPHRFVGASAVLFMARNPRPQ
jgi:hypothetical protein